MSVRVDVRGILEALACGDPRCECQRSLRRGRGKTHCPCHNDEKPSLNLTVAHDGTILLRCHAGCQNRDVIRALQDRGLWPRRERRERPAARETRYELRDVEGTLVAVHVRLDGPDGKRMWWELPDGTKGLGGRRVEELPLYGVDKVGDVPEVVVVEGEKACTALQRIGLPTVGTVTGASVTPSDDVLRPLIGRRVFLWPDNDEPGRAHMERIAARLRALGCADIRWVEWPDAPPHGDAADFTKRGGTADDVRQLLAAARPWTGARTEPTHDVAQPLDVGALLSPARATDRANGERLCTLLRERVLWVPAWGWLVWTGTHWTRDDDGARVLGLASEALTRSYLEQAIADPENRREWIAAARSVESRSRIAAALEFVKGTLRAQPDEFDQHPELLNTPSGVVDLRTGVVLPHRPELRFTHITNAPYDPTATAPRWERFVAEVLPDPDERAFVQKLFGYALRGDNRERLFVVLWGTGKNGKSAFCNALAAALGSYSAETPPETFLANRSERVRNDLARLVGVRLAMASESESGARLDEAAVKLMTGNDRLAVRFLFREYFEYVPQFLPLLRTNHKPQVKGLDQAIWDRLVLIPFRQRFERGDPALGEQLRAEAAGILRWLVEGYRQYLVEGLTLPASLRVARDAYRGEDPLARFWSECVVTDPRARTPARALYDAYHEWCEREQVEPLARQTFARIVSDLGIERVKTRDGWFYLGVRLTDPFQPDGTPPDDGTERDVGDVCDAISGKVPAYIGHAPNFPPNNVTNVTNVTLGQASETERDVGDVCDAISGKVPAYIGGAPDFVPNNVTNVTNVTLGTPSGTVEYPNNGPPLERRRCPVCRRPYEVRATDRPGWVQVRCGCRDGAWDWVRTADLARTGGRGP